MPLLQATICCFMLVLYQGGFYALLFWWLLILLLLFSTLLFDSLCLLLSSLLFGKLLGKHFFLMCKTLFPIHLIIKLSGSCLEIFLIKITQHHDQSLADKHENRKTDNCLVKLSNVNKFPKCHQKITGFIYIVD